MTNRSRSVSVLLVVLVVAIGGGVYWFFRDDSPAKVSLDTAAQSAGTASNGSTSTNTNVDGTWNIDTKTGKFDFKTATGSFVGFRIKEHLSSLGSTTAGGTGTISGSMTISGAQVTAADFTVDLTTIKTNESMRDGRVQQALETDQFPEATFKLTSPIDLGTKAGDGHEVDVTATGDLTMHGVTKSVTIPLQAKVKNGTVVVVGSVDVTFSDYGVSVPKAPIVLSVDDHGTLELQFLLKKS